MVAPQLGEVDVGRIGKQHQNQSNLGQQMQCFVANLQRYQSEGGGTGDQPKDAEQYRPGQDRSFDLSANQAIRDKCQRDCQYGGNIHSVRCPSLSELWRQVLQSNSLPVNPSIIVMQVLTP